MRGRRRRGERLVRFRGPGVAFFVGGVKGEPGFGIELDVEAPPVEIVARQVELLFVRRQDVAGDQAIKLPMDK